jgi:hypothetical protein
MDTTRMRIMTLSRGSRSITVWVFFAQHLYGRSPASIVAPIRQGAPVAKL